MWRATDGAQTVALKVLHQHRVDSEPYQRFRQEVVALALIGPRPGVMPLLASELPKSPSTRVPAWLAMPVAVPLADTLSNQLLREVVSAVASIADTLARLAKDFGIHHRDIKPSNLYLLDGVPSLSDFGLVTLPESVDLTLPGQPLGPRFFLPYEMMVNPSEADPEPADVYCLAKTLWVLCVDQKWPPQGEQQASNAEYSVGRIRPHPLAEQLDALIERCTKHAPSSRPSMSELANDLNAWLAMDAATPQREFDVADTWGRLRETAEPRLREVREEAEQNECFATGVRRLQQLLSPLHANIRRNYAAAEFDRRMKFVDTMFYEWPQHEISHEDIRAVVLAGPGWNPIRLIIGTAVRTRTDGTLHFQGLFYLGRTETAGGYIAEWKSEKESAPCGSIAAEAGLTALAAAMQNAFPEWLEKFTEALRDGDE